MQRYQAAIFDFDGTLVDSSEGIINCVLYALHKFGIRETDREKLKYFIGPPLYHSFRELYAVDEADAERLVEYYRERYRTVGFLEGTVYEGIPELLAALKRAGVRTAVCSSKPEKFVLDIAEHFGFRALLDHISAMTFSNNKEADKTPLLKKALALCEVEDASRAAMVGDRHFDMTAACNCAADAIGVAYGFGSREELQQAGAKRIVQTVPELHALLLGEESR